jgi:hypothetical protein
MTKFNEILIEMKNIHNAKNHDYGDSFNKGMDEIGLPYGVGRLYDKMNRILTISKNPDEIKVKDEKLEDTLLDLANYSVMLLSYLREKNDKNE